MTHAQAFYSFWASFGIPAYEENSVPTGDDAPAFPYITYQFAMDGYDAQTVLTASVWYRSSSPRQVEEKTAEIAAALQNKKRRLLLLDKGAMLLRPGLPFAQLMGDESDDLIKRMVLNVEVLFVNTF